MITSPALARRIGVSPPTVRRYAKRLNLNSINGFSEEEAKTIEHIIQKNILTPETTEQMKKDTLTEREKEVLEMRKSKTFKDIGLILNLSRERIRQIEAKALYKLKSQPELKSDKDKDFTIKEVSIITGVRDTTLRSHVKGHNLGKEKMIDGIKRFFLSQEDIDKIQEYYATRKVTAVTKKQTFQDLAQKSTFLVYIPGVRELAGFQTIEEIEKCIYNSPFCGQIIVFEKVEARVDIKLNINRNGK